MNSKNVIGVQLLWSYTSSLAAWIKLSIKNASGRQASVFDCLLCFDKSRTSVNGTKVKLTDSFPGLSGHAPASHTRERAGTHSTGGWVGPRAGMDGCGIS
jgi:hypothetical protein